MAPYRPFLEREQVRTHSHQTPIFAAAALLDFEVLPFPLHQFFEQALVTFQVFLVRNVDDGKLIKL
jgi:hypothetical protein